jgi:diguanylate cyclase (GGDEF)-like protein/PAS domain S-box-containing protein
MERDWARYKAIVEQSYDLLMIVDSEHKLQWGNAAFERALGYKPESLVGTDFTRLVHDDDLPALFATISRVGAAPGGAGAVNFRMRAAQGSWRFIEASATNLCHEPAVDGFVVSLRDVTERVLAEAAYQDLVDRAQEIVYTTDLDGRFVSINPAGEQITGYTVEELLTMSLLDVIAPERRDHAEAILARIVAGSEETTEMQLVAKDGRKVLLELSARAVKADRSPGHIEGIARDITERRRLEEQLRYDAVHDALTGLPNRTLLVDRLTQTLARRPRNRSQVAVMMLDIDGLELVNDELGHVAGDEVLTELGRRLESISRAGETIARVGGDDFAVVADHVREVGGADALAKRILSTFAQPFIVADRARQITGSIGIATATDASTPDQLLRDADTALYRTKTIGGGSFGFFDVSMRDRLLRELAIRQNLTHALRDHELEVHYQPIVALDDHAILAVEALVRWPQPESGWIPPSDFIPLAEQTGLIVTLGRYVFDEAARQAARWRAEFPGALPLGVFVNISARDLAQPDIVPWVTDTLKRNRLSARDIALEVTERAFVDTDNEILARNLKHLTKRGIRLILDDFGTGYSSLSSLNRLPLTAIKIDRSFIDAIKTPDSDAPITRAVVSLGETLGMTVIAEGIETDTQLDYLHNIRCPAAQGFKLARPQPARDITDLIRSQTRKAQRADTVML